MFWLEDLTQADAARVGRKCANLGELTRAGFNVPPGFALCLDVYDDFLHDTGGGGVIARISSTHSRPTRTIRSSWADSPRRANGSRADRSPGAAAGIAEALAAYYDELSRRAGVSEVLVATRSAGPASHPGQYESFLSLSGHAAVMEGVKKVWSSTFNTRSLIARARKGLPLHSDPIGVAVLVMVDADAAGVMFTAEPTTANARRVIIEGSCGLGEVVVAGGVIPDDWTVDATDFDDSRKKDRTPGYGRRAHRGGRVGGRLSLR